ncbi:MBL fold metallo-hydrolase [Deinococcus misasensis]|uniref:MBL fold metallo-hydrolase n=1 Tax=Deinococcus misasensis TaxID=392413 RepID=UPI000554609F|nr:MBL fold metallo-hydrolase [Deinococcus misasensis]
MSYQEFIEPNFVRSIDPEEFSVVILGTGTPRAYRGAAKPSVAVIAAGKVFLVDSGGEVVRQLIESSIMPQRIEHVFFTHHHYDHNGGFLDLFISSWRTHVGIIDGRKNAMKVYGPTNTRQIIQKYHDALGYDIDLRLSYNKSDTDGALIEYTESDNGVLYDQDGLKVTAFEVDHRPVKPCIGLKFEYRGKTVVVSGDTRPVENMVIHSQNADLLVHDAYNKKWLDQIAAENPELAIQVTNPAKYHTTTLEAAEIAAKAGVKHLVLTHHIPAPRRTPEAEASYLEGMQEIFQGKVTLGRDLMEFTLLPVQS